ncbi:response regulator [Pseudobacteriovorax antillogorgiicola]|nr:response regulator [Pseudobacteriovorax antillogorgiicola]
MVLKNFIAFLFMVQLTSAPLLAKDVNPKPRAVAGQLDLSHWDFDKLGPISLAGEWKFWWKAVPDPVGDNDRINHHDTYYMVPEIWKNLSDNALPGAPQGFASYILDVKLPKQEQEAIAINLSDVYSAQKMEVWHQDNVVSRFKQGVVGRNKSQEVPHYGNQIRSIPMGTDSIRIVWQVSNFHHSRGGARKTPTIGLESDLQHRLNFRHMTKVALIVLLFTMAFYLFGLVSQRPDDQSSLWFGITLSFMGSWLMLNSRLVQYWTGGSGVQFHEWLNTAEYMSLYLTTPTLMMFINSIASTPLFRKVCQGSWIIFGIYAFIPFTNPLEIYSHYHKYYFYLDPIFQFLALAHLIRESWKGSHDAKLTLIGFSVYVLARSHDQLKVAGYFRTPFLAPYGLGLFVLIQSHMMARFFAATYRKAEGLSKDLQAEVDIQTQKLRVQKEKLEAQHVEITKAHEVLKQGDQQKTAFFRNISHELRTPLNIILSSLTTAEDTYPNDRHIEIAQRNTKRLLRLVNQLLDYQKISMSQMRMQLEEVHLDSIFENIVLSMNEMCKAREIQFDFNKVAQNTDGWVILGQIDALEKIIFNFLSNALKFTPSKGRITLQLVQKGAFARIQVSDSGPGIPEKDQDQIFEVFSQVEEHKPLNKQGTGIGLALVKELSKQMQGRVGLESLVGQGTKIWAEFPLISQGPSHYEVVYVESDTELINQFRTFMYDHGLDQRCSTTTSLERARTLLEDHVVRIMICSTNWGEDLGKFLDDVHETHPHCSRLLISDPKKKHSLLSLSTLHFEASFILPFDLDLLHAIQSRLARYQQDSSKPVLDLLYIEDDSQMRSQFLRSLSTHTLLERFKIIASPDDFKEIVSNHRIKVIVADENLGDGIHGVDLLAYSESILPDSFRILYTAEQNGQVLKNALEKAKAHYVIYKPANLGMEMKVIESYADKSPYRESEGKLPRVEPNSAFVDALAADNFDTGIVEDISNQDLEIPENSTATILVIDDVQDLRTVIKSTLEQEGYHVVQAVNGRQGYNKARRLGQELDVIITDWLMPEMDGQQFLEALHHDENLSSIPTILLTAKAGNESRSLGLKLGASVYLSKPFDRLELLSVIENLLLLKKRERRISELNRFINQNVLQRFLPPNLVKELVDGQAVFNDTPSKRVITVLFADLCRFTSSTEQLGADAIARILNKFLIEMTEVIFSEEGTIDKFIGDGILVIFGAPEEMSAQKQALKATRCANKMQEKLAELNETWLSEEEHQFDMRIGVHQGVAIVGGFGGAKRSDYTAIGGTVNLASRIESRAEGGETLVSAQVIQHLSPSQYEVAGDYHLRGINETITLYRLREQKSISSAS